MSYVGAVAHHLLVTQRPNFGTSFADAFRPANQGAPLRAQTDINNGIIRGPFGKHDLSSVQWNLELQRPAGKCAAQHGRRGSALKPLTAIRTVSMCCPTMFPPASTLRFRQPLWRIWSRPTWQPAAVALRRKALRHRPQGCRPPSPAQKIIRLCRRPRLKAFSSRNTFAMRLSKPTMATLLSMCASVFAASVIYDLPFGHDKLLLSNLRGPGDLLVSGWGLASIFDTQTGVPFIPTTGADGNRDGDTTDRVVIVGPVAHRAGKLTKNFLGHHSGRQLLRCLRRRLPLRCWRRRHRSAGAYASRLSAQPRHLQLGFPTEQNHQSDRAFPPALHLGLLQRPESFQLQ